MLVAEMPELGTITGEQAAALVGLAPVVHDSGTLRGSFAESWETTQGHHHSRCPKLVNLANALCKKRQKWVLPKACEIQVLIYRIIGGKASHPNSAIMNNL